jgi:hypothetical protein
VRTRLFPFTSIPMYYLPVILVFDLIYSGKLIRLSEELNVNEQNIIMAGLRVKTGLLAWD